MLRLPILVLQCSKGSHLERGPGQTEEKFGIFGREMLMKLPDIFMEESELKGRHFQWDSFPRLSGTMSEHAKNLGLGREVARFGEGTKRERLGDNLTCQQR